MHKEIRRFFYKTTWSLSSSAHCLEDELLEMNIHTPCSLYPRLALLGLGGFDERFKRAQEYNLNLRLSLAGFKFIRSPGIVAYARVHSSPDRISNNQTSKAMHENNKLRARLYVQMFRDKYGNYIPPEIQSHFVKSYIYMIFNSIVHGNFRAAALGCSQVIYLRPGLKEFISGLTSGILKFTQQKWRGLRLYFNTIM